MAAVSVNSIQAEHHPTGRGLGVACPRLSWRIVPSTSESTTSSSSTSLVTNWIQTAYEVIIEHVSDSIRDDEKYSVASSDSVLVPWPSRPLNSRERATVRVRARGREPGSEPQWTEWASLNIQVGLLERHDWDAEMVGGPVQPRDEPKRPFLVRKRFTLNSVGVARLYCTAQGIYHPTLNGVSISPDVLQPGWTSYRHNHVYQVYDVTSFLREGENVLASYVGEGWFATRLGRPGGRCLYGDRLGFLAQLEVDDSVICRTDATWELADGPIVTSEIYDGEVTDSFPPGWELIVSSTGSAEVIPFPKGKLRTTDAPPVQRIIERQAVDMLKTPSGRIILDFGQNLVGWVRINVDLPGEGEIVMRHAEVLEHGELGTRPLRMAKATAKIRLGNTKGWEPTFTFFGFRYVEITGIEKVDAADFTAVVIASALSQVGTFTCSHPLLNQLHSNVIWSTRGNFVSLPTDCPQRDERLGWTGDIQVFAPTANYLFDTSGFLDSWLRDVQDETLYNDGICPEVVPWIYAPLQPGRDVRAMGIWGDCTALTPWDMYRSTGDVAFLSRQWESMVLWLERGVPRGEDGLYSHSQPQFGDWLDPRAPPSYPAHGQTDCHLACDAYLVHTTRTVARIAKILGKEADVIKWEAEYEKLKHTFQQEYMSPRGRLMSDTQTAIALALTFDLFGNEKQKAHAIERLEYLCRWDVFRISTGFAGTPIILNALADAGLLHIAYRMLQEGECPSWLYPVKMGATTIWERWDSMLPDGSINPGQMTSFNHYALGAVASFLHSVVGGLAPYPGDLGIGWRKALIKPQPGGTVTSASTSHMSPYGLYAVSWSIEAGKLSVSATVPPNGTAVVVLPGLTEEVGSGEWTYKVDWGEDDRWPPKAMPGPSAIQAKDEYEA